MREVAIVSPVRTAVGNFGGGMRDISAAELGSIVIKESLSRAGLDAEKVDDVILGHGYPSGENPAIGRLVSLKAGLPSRCPVTSWTGAARRVSRPSSTPPCSSKRRTPTWLSPGASKA